MVTVSVQVLCGSNDKLTHGFSILLSESGVTGDQKINSF